jgi:NADPH2:quinone reductase
VNGTTAELALGQLARLRAGERAVILGVSGGIGSVAARIAVAAGARQVIGVIGREAKRPAAQAAGCTDIVLSRDLARDIPELTGGEGADVVFDPVGGGARETMFGLLAPFGRLVIVGNASGRDVLLSSDAAWHGSRSVTGLSLGGIAHLQPGRSGRPGWRSWTGSRRAR